MKELDKSAIADIERTLTRFGELAIHDDFAIKHHGKGYCQGIGYVLDKIGFEIEWEGHKAKIVEKENE